MTDDTTLEDFLPSEPPEAAAERDEENADERVEPADGNEAAATPTYAWGEYDCATCEATVSRAWWTTDGYVCDTCKKW